MKRRRVSCPTPEKIAHKTLKVAEQNAHLFARTHVAYEEVDPIYAYQCRCDRWHLTHKESGKHKTILVLSIPTALQEWARTKVSTPPPVPPRPEPLVRKSP